MNDDQIFLANAYLDGELTVDERRIAEADPEVMTEVDQLRALQAEIRAVEAPSAARRDSAIAAAMAEFGAASSAATSAGAAAGGPVVPFRPRPVYAKYLAVAAAIVAVAGLGFVVSQANLGGGEDDGASVAEESTAQFEARADDGAEGTAEGSAEAADDAGGDTDIAAAAEAADATIAASAGDEAAAEAAEDTAEEMAEDAADAEVAAESGVAAAERIAVPPTFDPDEPITDKVELGIYGSYLLNQRDEGLLAPTPNTQCVGNYEILDAATYLFGDELTPVFIAILDDEERVVAVNADTCVVLEVSSVF